MRFNNFIQSALTIGLLASIEDANATKQDLHCPEITIVNNSTSDGKDANWDVGIDYRRCGFSHELRHERVKVGKTAKISLHPGLPFNLVRLMPNGSIRSIKRENQEITQDTRFVCSGTSESAHCEP